jgi:CubicO group peptidase (beta-lactamase class C family)
MRSVWHWRWLVVAVPVIVCGLCLVMAVGGSKSFDDLATASWQELSLPDSPIGRLVGDYLEAFNSGDEAALASFVRERFTATGPGGASLDDRLRSQQRLYRSSRGLSVYSADQKGLGELDLVVQLRLTRQWRRMTFLADNTGPQQISGIRIVPVDAPQFEADAGQQPLSMAVKKYLDDLVWADEFSGVVLIAHGDRIVFSEARGMANQEESIANTLDTPFNYASVGKMFTAVAIGQLVQLGKLSFEDTLEMHLPEYPRESARQITIDQLLTHRSGIVDFFEAAEQLKKDGHQQPITQHDWVFADHPLGFIPGERYEYSNSNYILLGAIVERLSGKSFEEYVCDHIFTPAGMTRTWVNTRPTGSLVPAVGYTEIDQNGKLTPGERRSNEAHLGGGGGAAGGGVTTATDMLRFANALRDQRLVSSAIASDLIKEQVPTGRPDEFYCRGFVSRHSDPSRIVGHSGGFPGVDAQVDFYGTGWTVVVLANYEGVGEPVARYIEGLLKDAVVTGEAITTPPEPK